jgi:membrane protease YdiL (CAAX protease family)
LYKKNEILFSIIWIIIYVVLASIGDNISIEIGIQKIITLPILIILSITLIIFIRKNNLIKKYGLCKPEVPHSKMLFYIPLIILITANLWYGVAMNYSVTETILYVLSMFCVGFLEEIIFRGLLFCSMAKNDIKSAIIVSSVTFGIGHIINLINGSGANILSNLLQVIYAMAIGFTFVMIFYKTKSLIPCIITHSVFNALSTFSNEAIMNPTNEIILGIIITIISAFYAIYIALILKEKRSNKEFN